MAACASVRFLARRGYLAHDVHDEQMRENLREAFDRFSATAEELVLKLPRRASLRPADA